MDTSATSEGAPSSRGIRTLAGKLSLLEELDQPGASVSAVTRRHDMNANLLFAWRRMRRKGLLEAHSVAPHRCCLFRSPLRSLRRPGERCGAEEALGRCRCGSSRRRRDRAFRRGPCSAVARWSRADYRHMQQQMAAIQRLLGARCIGSTTSRPRLSGLYPRPGLGISAIGRG